MLSAKTLHNPPRLHFSGIGGTAMVAGARLALEVGWEVRGSDNPLYPPTSEMVRELGVQVYEGYAAENLAWQPDLVLVGNALSRGNPEVEEMLRQRIPYASLPEWLKSEVLQTRRPVVIAGTHGKTTTTALTAFLLDRCGLNPGFLIGGQPLDFPYSSRLGQEGGPFVIEGDEYDTAFFDKRAKFFHYIPEIAVVTSIEYDHGDIYRDVEEIERAFCLMLRQVPPGGWLIACADDLRSLSLTKDAPCRVVTYGFSENAHWRGEEMGISSGFSGLAVYRGEKRFAELAVPLFGHHNLRNTLAAVAVAATLGATSSEIQTALMEFRGVRRRMEVFLNAGQRVFVDDFAHHPTAIRETIAAARLRWPDHKLRVLVEPRSNTMVRKIHEKDLAEALGGADEVVFGPIYRAERIPGPERLDREKILSELKKHGISGFFTDSVPQITKYLIDVDETRTIDLILSNGSFGGLYEALRDAFGSG
ncbi:MAG: Mur ligase family protein [bacterium]